MSRRAFTKRKLSLGSVILIAIVMAIQYVGSPDDADQLSQNIQQGQPGLYTVTRFIDGDTIAVDMNGKAETIRMIGIDTPETHKPNSPVQCYGPAASAYTKQLIGSGKVRLEADSQNTNRDRYDRLLRYVYLQDGRLLAEEILANGYGFAYTQFPFSKTAVFVAAEQTARQDSKGLWANCQVTVQANGRKQTNDL